MEFTLGKTVKWYATDCLLKAKLQQTDKIEEGAIEEGASKYGR